MKVKQYAHYKRIIKVLFSSDEEFVQLCNRNGGSTTEEAVERAYKLFKNCSDTMKFFVVRDKNKLVGYFATQTYKNFNFMIGSFVRPNYRNKESLSSFWANIKSTINTPFYSILPKANDRAIKNYLRSGGTIINEDNVNNEPCVLIEFKELSCQ